MGREISDATHHSSVTTRQCMPCVRRLHTARKRLILQVGPGVDVLCKVRARPCNKAVNVMNRQLKEQEGAAAADQQNDEGISTPRSQIGDENRDAPSAKRRRLASFFVQSDSAAADAGASAEEAPEVIVAIRKGNVVGTAFHPELTNDSRWHAYFVRLVEESVHSSGDPTKVSPATAGVPLEAGRAEAALG